MAAGMECVTTPVMALHTSPALVAFASFLQLPALGLEARVAQELAENPALEEDTSPACCPVCGDSVGGAVPGPCPCLVGGDRHSERPGAGGESWTVREPRDEDRAAWFLADVRAALPAADAPLADHLVGSLGPRGRLDRSVEEIAVDLGVPPGRVLRVLAALRAAAPPGTGARDLRECLLLQLERWEERHGTREPLVRAVLAHHLAALADEDGFAGAARALGVPVAEIGRVREFVRSELRPSAALDLTPPAAEASAPPDLVITRHPENADAYTVTLLEPLRLRLSVSPSYLAYLTSGLAPSPGGSEGREDERQARLQVARAREFLSRLDRRWRTLHRVAQHVVDAQRPFLDGGPAQLRPLCRREVAEALGLHESTVSRAVAGRVALLPCRRTMPLSGFFAAATGVRTALRDLVERETLPLSDAELAGLLAERGYPVARRTVAKYRTGLGIEPRARRAAVRRAAA
ncbi:RNA polymerase factor sigma-54 [Streptomyces sp. NPDC055721]|uniref:RNA polymerase factor sigma-54 n=1 Tax=Streptomyces sp. NPDC127132 TaxID=3345374 RepID=UPI003642CEAE